jgi:nicotinate dehydrogenase subunit B
VKPPSRSLAANPRLDAWIRIDAADTVTVLTGKVELGQGVRTAVARIAADELDVSLERIRVAPVDTAHSPDEFYTSSSVSMTDGGTAVRHAAAEARAHLLLLAAQRLEVAPAQLAVDDGRVHTPDGRAVSYWELLGGRPFDVPVTGTGTAKAPDRHRYVGRPGPRIDLPGILSGETTFVQDLELPGMLHARVLRPPSPAARLESLDDAAVRSRAGMVDVVRSGSFVAVLAEREEVAISSLEALRRAARWTERETLPPFRDLAGWLLDQPTIDFPVVDGTPTEGPVPPVLEPSDAARTIDGTWFRPYVMHGSIGPSAAAAQWSGDGDQLCVWSPAQGPFVLRTAIAEAVGLDAASVRVVHTPGPGCYGDNGAEDAALDAALVARAVPGRPVLVKWTRLDEHTWEPYGPPMAVRIRASIDDEGRLLSWNQDVHGTTHMTRAFPFGECSVLLAARHTDPPMPVQQPAPWLIPEAGLHRNATPLYAVPDKRIVKHFVPAMPLRTSSLRALGAHPNVFAIESAMDELAEAAGVDPVEFRLRHLEDPRARDVVRAAAERAGWRPGEEREFGLGRGFGFARYKNAAGYAAVVIDLALDDETSTIRVDRAVIAADVGEIVDPAGLVNQLEGGLVQSLSWTLKEEVRFDRIRVTSTDWDSYPILTFSETPEIETVLLDRPGEPFLGAGEITQGPTAGAVANALHDAVGLRVRSLPLTPERIRAAAAR